MEVKSYDGTTERSIRFKRGEVDGELEERPLAPKEKRTGTVVRWLPDLEVFTDINIPHENFKNIMRRQSVVNSGIRFVLHLEQEDGSFSEDVYYYQNGISDYLAETVGDSSLTAPVSWQIDRGCRDS
jgi:DNA gyrase subunit B